MLAFRRRCAQTAHISLHSSYFQRAQTQNQPDRQSLGASRNLASRFFRTSVRRLRFVLRCYRLASVTVWRRLRFGEAVFRPQCKNPQEEKTPAVTFFSFFPIFQRNPMVGEILTIWSYLLAQLSFAAAARTQAQTTRFTPFFQIRTAISPERIAT